MQKGLHIKGKNLSARARAGIRRVRHIRRELIILLVTDMRLGLRRALLLKVRRILKKIQGWVRITLDIA